MLNLLLMLFDDASGIEGKLEDEEEHEVVELLLMLLLFPAAVEVAQTGEEGNSWERAESEAADDVLVDVLEELLRAEVEATRRVFGVTLRIILAVF